MRTYKFVSHFIILSLLYFMYSCKNSLKENSNIQSDEETPIATSTTVGDSAGISNHIDENYFQPAAPRLIAIGDLHGDFSATEQALRLAGAINNENKWIGGSLVVVQTGDQLDRGKDERKIIDFLDNIHQQAEVEGGAVLALIGNHEFMNMYSDFRYVHKNAINDFNDVEPYTRISSKVAKEYQSRAKVFSQGGGMALRFAKRHIVLQVGDTLFAHAGVMPKNLDYGIAKINAEAASWMIGDLKHRPSWLTNSTDNPLWTRVFGESGVSAETCLDLKNTLERLGAKRLVVGHTIQENGINTACDEQVVRIDVGMSSVFRSKLMEPIQVLEITAQGINILKKKRD